MSEDVDKSARPRSLALSIATCSEIAHACGDQRHPCHKIVTAQEYLGTEIRQGPEPWAGNLSAAPVLFVASNPSISEATTVGEVYPLVSYSTGETVDEEWPVERVVDFHLNRFDQSRDRPYVIPKAQRLCRDGHYRGSDKSKPGKGSQTYWRNAFQQTRFILGREPDISIDVCLTEVVHCKTRKETDKAGKNVGLAEAMPLCAGKYLDDIIQNSGALLAVISGSVARDAVVGAGSWVGPCKVTWDIDKSRFGVFPKGKSKPAPGAHLGVAAMGDRRIIVCAMKHLSNGYGRGSFSGVLGEEASSRLALLMQAIEGGREPAPGSRTALLDRLGITDE